MKLSPPIGGQPSHRTPSLSFRGANSIPRFDSFVSLHSTMSDTFFDAVEDVSFIIIIVVVIIIITIITIIKINC